MNLASTLSNLAVQQLIRSMLWRGKENGFNVLRAWAHTVSPQYALETSPGQYNEAGTLRVVWMGRRWAHAFTCMLAFPLYPCCRTSATAYRSGYLVVQCLGG